MPAIVSIVKTKHIWIKHILMQDVAYNSYKNINIRLTCHPEMSGAKIKKYIRNQTYMSFRRSYRIKALQQKIFYFQTNCSIYLCTKWDLIKSLNKQLFNKFILFVFIKLIQVCLVSTMLAFSCISSFFILIKFKAHKLVLHI